MHGQVKIKTSEQLQRERQERQNQKIKAFCEVTDVAMSLYKDHVMDENALEATKKVLTMNTEFYTLWNYRRQILEKWAQEQTLDQMVEHYQGEMAFTAEVIRLNPKSYWIWHHRKWAGAKLGHECWDWKSELKLCTQLLALDTRNFHCWSYRRYVCEKGKISIESEFNYTTTKIEENFSNYSAWHQRSKLIPLMGEKKFYGDQGSEEVTEKSMQQLKKVLKEELELVWKAMYTQPEDQSPWIYHRWLIDVAKKIPAAPDYNPQEVLEQELQNTLELLSEEQRAKWPLLASVVLMQELNKDGKFTQDIKKNIQVLCEVDTIHQEYYKDLLKKFAS
eukprot:Phypoly_transcript_11671.p1 GENE.Phypoly_transcript_11671~~Phypoly_transcript_11671.p1  ORF type:complete len:334 (+),score=48.20 Phypoly_transcript_11671:98-1099(+)